MNWLRKLVGDRTPEWSMISVTYLLAAGLAGTSAVYSQNFWMSLLDAALAGWCLHGTFSSYMMKWYRDAFEDMRRALHEMHELNKAMIEDRVRMHLAKVEVVETDDDGPAKTIN